MTKGAIVVDSNIIIYAINSSSPKHRAAQTFLKENINPLVFFHQNIFETLRVLTHPKYPSPMKTNIAIKAVMNIAAIGKIHSPTVETQSIALELLKRFQVSGNRIFDIYLIATMLSHDVTRIATDNEKDFKLFKEIKVENPL